jgi:hypothetical protein
VSVCWSAIRSAVGLQLIPIRGMIDSLGIPKSAAK